MLTLVVFQYIYEQIFFFLRKKQGLDLGHFPGFGSSLLGILWVSERRIS